MITVLVLLAVLAFLVTIASALSPPKAPLWVAVLLLALCELIRVLPIR